MEGSEPQMVDDQDPEDHIDEIWRLGNANYRIARQALGDTLTLVEDLHNLYRLLGELVSDSGVTPEDEVVADLYFLLFCQYELSVGVLSLLRGHRTDSHFYARQAIESAAFAARIRQSHLADVWLRRAGHRSSVR